MVVNDSGHLRDISSVCPDGLRGLIATPGWTDRASAAASVGPDIDPAEVTLLPPVPDARRVLCTGFNYRSHAAETAQPPEPEYPTFFSRFPSSLVGSGTPIVSPTVSSYLDWEGEVAVIIGIGGRQIPAEQAHQAIAGYTCFGDHSVRDFQMHGTQATAGKNFDRSGSMGPWLVTPDEAGDPAELEVFTHVNGVQVQHGRLSDLIFEIGDLIAYVSTFTTLEPGDVIATGTPAGIGARMEPPRFLRVGDLVEVEVPRVGRLSNPVIEEQP